MTKTAEEWAVSLCPWAKSGHYPQMDGSDRRCCKKCQPIEQALKLYAIEQMGPMAKALQRADNMFFGWNNYDKIREVIEEALDDYTRLKEEMK